MQRITHRSCLKRYWEHAGQRESFPLGCSRVVRPMLIPIQGFVVLWQVIACPYIFERATLFKSTVSSADPRLGHLNTSDSRCHPQLQPSMIGSLRSPQSLSSSPPLVTEPTMLPTPMPVRSSRSNMVKKKKITDRSQHLWPPKL